MPSSARPERPDPKTVEIALGSMEKIALREGIDLKEVRENIQRSIDAAFAKPDPKIQAQWASMPWEEAPTPEELIAWLAKQLKEKEDTQRE